MKPAEVSRNISVAVLVQTCLNVERQGGKALLSRLFAIVSKACKEIEVHVRAWSTVAFNICNDLLQVPSGIIVVFLCQAKAECFRVAAADNCSKASEDSQLKIPHRV